MKICTECKYYYYDSMFCSKPRCEHPKTTRISNITGEEIYITCEESRDRANCCFEEGFYFMERPIVKIVKVKFTVNDKKGKKRRLSFLSRR